MRFIALLLTLVALNCWAGEKPKIVFIAGEYEYSSRETLPLFAQALAARYNVETTVLKRPDDNKLQTIPGLDALKQADLVVLFVRRMTLPDSELKQIRDYLSIGKPLLAIRTSSHAFENWKVFDKEVLGGNYQNHHGNALKTTVSLIPSAHNHPILNGVTGFISDGSLYKNTPLHSGTKPLLMGKVEGHPPEPVAWTHTYQGARIFYTSLGHPNDFKEPSFKALLHNAIDWTLGADLKVEQ
jgi:type 1 glutamine amidotransferase